MHHEQIVRGRIAAERIERIAHACARADGRRRARRRLRFRLPFELAEARPELQA